MTTKGRQPEHESFVIALLRWIAAALLMLYGFAKLNGSQFTVLDSVLATPLGEVSGFWLTWHYFGWSHIYGSLIALAQIAGALLLTHRRYAPIGAVLLVPILINIILLNLLFGIDAGATIVSVFLLFVVSIVLAPHVALLRDALLPHNSVPLERRMYATWSLRVALLAAACGFTYYVANYNNRAPTSIDGVWQVSADASALERIYFEYNRAHLAVFQYTNRSEQHHFEVAADTVRVWKTWLRKDTLLYEGIFNGDVMQLRDMRSAAHAIGAERDSRAPLRLTRIMLPGLIPVGSSRVTSGTQADTTSQSAIDPVVARYSSRIPPDVLVRRRACPGECCVYGEWRADSSLVAYNSPRTTDPPGFTIAPGTRFIADSGHVYITGIALVAVHDSVSDRPAWAWSAGDTLVLLDYLGEGHYRVWSKGEVRETGGFWGAEAAKPVAELIGRYGSEWWAAVRMRDGRAGWIRADHSRITGADACGGN